MATIVQRAVLLVVLLALGRPARAQPAVEITLEHSTAAEAQTRDQLRRLLATYDLSPWIYTRSVVIDERALPFSHPVLTLHTRHVKDDDLLLSTFLHEQFHWFLEGKREATGRAIDDLRKVFPTVPVGGAEGARDEDSTYLHLVVCYLEKQAVQRVLGELRARQVMEFWAADHYTWVYRTIQSRARDVGAIIGARKLLPER